MFQRFVTWLYMAGVESADLLLVGAIVLVCGCIAYMVCAVVDGNNNNC
jgi:hypothetical protein